jgi:hypothetical protein
MNQLSRLRTTRSIAREIGEALRCPTCRKHTTVANTAGHRQRFQGERVSLETHCACRGGPAHHLLPVDEHPDEPSCVYCGQAPAVHKDACKECC